MKTVAVIEGFSGGPMHTRQFRKSLSDAGLRVIKDRTKADIIIAHSAGIYVVPVNAKAKLLFLIGPTYWPNRRLVNRLLRHMQSTRRYHVSRFGWRFYILRKTLELYYFFRRHKYLWLGIIHNNRLDHLNKLISYPGRKTIIIRNKDDEYTSPEIKNAISHKQLKFAELPGIHDDYVTNPKPYIDLLLKAI